MRTRRRFLDLQGRQQARLLLVDGEDAVDRSPIADRDRVPLHPPQSLQCRLRAKRDPGKLEPLAYHPVEARAHEAHPSVRPTPIRQPVVHRCDLDLGFEHPEAPLDARKRLVADHALPSLELRRIGHQQQLAVPPLGALQGSLIDAVAKQLAAQIDLDDVGQARLAHLVEKVGLRTRIAEAAAAMTFARVLRIPRPSRARIRQNCLFYRQIAEGELPIFKNLLRNIVGKATRGGCLIDVKATFDAERLKQAGLPVWRLRVLGAMATLALPRWVSSKPAVRFLDRQDNPSAPESLIAFDPPTPAITTKCRI